MKKVYILLFMVLVPFLGHSTSVSCAGRYWPDAHRTISKEGFLLFEKDGDVKLSSDVVLLGVDIVVVTKDNSVLKVMKLVTVNSELEVLSQDEIPQDGCYVRISQGDKYVLYFVTRD